MSQPIFHIPAGACDSHVHVFNPDRFPYAGRRAYTPPAADVPALEAHLGTIAMARVVLVQPSVYREDNACMVNALARLGSDRARGVAVVDPAQITPSEMARLHEAGVRGLRLNLHVGGEGPELAHQQVRQIGPLLSKAGMHLQVHADLALHAALIEAYQALELPVVLDHFAGGLVADPASEQRLELLLQALARMPLYIKLSAPYRLWAGAGADHAARLARAFVAVAPDRVVWGSDWPHTGGSGNRGHASQTPGGIEPFRTIDNRQVLQDLLTVLPDDAARHRLLVVNPAALYGFSI